MDNKIKRKKGPPKGYIPWNKGLTKETDARVKKNTDSLLKAYKSGKIKPYNRIGIQSIEQRQATSARMSLNNPGGKSKWFEVAGKKVQGTWERNIALKFEETNVIWEKPKTNNDIWKYVLDGKIKSYSPDFYLPEYDIWLEVKGYWWGNDKEKMDIVQKTYPYRKILIIEKEEYNKILSGEQVWSL